MTASLTGLSVASRIALAGGPPNVKPVAFLCIIAGVIGGPVTGFVVGALSMFISDLYFGGGPWTITGAASMGAIAFLAGLLWKRRVNIARAELVVAGFLLTAAYDVTTSLASAWMFGYKWWISILQLYVPFFPPFGVPYSFGLAHELTTAVLMGTVGPTLITRSRVLIGQKGREMRHTTPEPGTSAT